MNDYPNLWKRKLIQPRIRERANHRCEGCDMEFQHGTNLAVSERGRRGNPIIGTVHHLDMDKANCHSSNLIYLCQRCHYRIHLYDWKPGRQIPAAWITTPPHFLQERFGITFYKRQLL